jgi:uncharacterized protein
MEFPVTTAYVAAVIGILQYILTLTVGLDRGRKSISLGDGGDEAFLKKMRRHGNLAENAALFIVLLALLELTGQQMMLVTVFGVLFVVARFSHAVAFTGTGPKTPFRLLGALGTLISGTGTAGTLLYTVAM